LANIGTVIAAYNPVASTPQVGLPGMPGETSAIQASTDLAIGLTVANLALQPASAKLSIPPPGAPSDFNAWRLHIERLRYQR
jgi:hypothetical protein